MKVSWFEPRYFEPQKFPFSATLFTVNGSSTFIFVFVLLLRKVTTQKCWRGNYIIEEIEVDLVVVVQVWRVGAHFKALVKLESLVPLVLPCIFLRPKRGLLHIVMRDKNAILPRFACGPNRIYKGKGWSGVGFNPVWRVNFNFPESRVCPSGSDPGVTQDPTVPHMPSLNSWAKKC